MKKKFASNQSYFFPYIGYFQLIDSVDEFQLYEYTNFSKPSWINRNRLMHKGNKKPFYISPTINKTKTSSVIGDVRFKQEINWKLILLGSITSNYNKAPFFNEVYPDLEKIINIKSDYLHEYNSLTIKGICNILGIKTKIIYKNSDVIEKNILKCSVEKNLDIKTTRILEFCKLHNSTEYINAIGGQELYKKEIFLQHGVKLNFINTIPYTYKQFNNEFTPHLSIIDTLMHLGIEGTKRMIKNYTLV